MINQYIELINTALKNEDNTIRSRAQFELIEQRNKNTIGFFDTCGQLLGGDEFDDFIRQSAATLLSRTTIMKNGNVFYWDILPKEIKEKVKNKALSVLVNNNNLIMKAGANVIASISFVEIPRNEWLEIIDLLAEHTRNNNFTVKNASITTIGFICQQFSFGNIKISFRVCEQLLGGIIIGTRTAESKQIVETSLVALRNSINFLSEILENENIRNQVFNILRNFITNEDLTETVYQGLYEFSKTCYHDLGPFMQTIVDLVVAHLRQRNENSIRALELLDTIGSEYLELIDDQIDRYNNQVTINNYLEPLQGVLLPEVMRCFLIETKDDLNFPEIRNSANKTLGTMIACGNREAVDMVINGVATILKSDNMGQQQASAILLACLCQYPQKDRQYVQKYMSDAFGPVIGLLSSSESVIVMNTLTGFITIAQHYPHYFYQHQHSQQILSKLFQLQGNSEQIKISVLKIFFNITENFKSQHNILLDKPEIFLSKIVGQLEAMLNDYRDNNIDYVERLTSIIINCLVKVDNRQIITHMLQFLIQKYYFFNGNQNNNFRYTQNDLEMISLSIMSLINTAILALEKYLPNEEIMNNTCGIVDLHLNKYGVDGEVIDVISSMAVAFKHAFERKGEQYWQYILHGLEMINNHKSFASALRCVGDYSRVYSQNFANKINDIMRKLLKLIHGNIERNLKVSIISCIGDMLLGLGILAEPYVNQIMNICELCFTAVYELSTLPTEKQYVEQLKAALVEMYACLLFALMSTTRYQHHFNQRLANHFDQLVVFIIKTCNRTQNPTIKYLRNSLYLLFDEIAFFWQFEQLRPSLSNAMNSNQIKQLVTVLGSLTNHEDIGQLRKHIEQRYIIMNKK